ncbi:MAG: leucine-rich repeat domain-containing protein [Oscillospiraceae bacterium]|nr:leucine-rich repeat domain-containing protein [Oscillospiraceae bacterium]
MKTITNETGIFTIDDNGVLINYQSTEDNQIAENVWRCLDIPEGVKVIPEEAFRRCHVQQRLTFPKSLRVIGAGHGCAFANSILPHVELPDTLEKLGDFVFGASTMDSLRIPKGLKSGYARQFKASTIGTLYLPEEFRAEGTPRGFQEKYEYGKEEYGYIRSMLVNNVEIGEIIFE